MIYVECNSYKRKRYYIKEMGDRGSFQTNRNNVDVKKEKRRKWHGPER